jgi:gamma-glutamylcyclotransferase (GGCT)/AIG2-like uncharacterized protein YtfP
VTWASDDATVRRPGSLLFAYGSLQFPEVLGALLGRVPMRDAATVPGWRAAPLVGRPYPGLVRDPHATASGIVLQVASRAEWDLLDAFEGEFYRRQFVNAEGRAPLHTYVWGTEVEALPGNWDRQLFAQRDLGAFVDGCRGWRSGYRIG